MQSKELTQLLKEPDKEYWLRAIYFPKDAGGIYHFRYIKNRFIKAGLRETKEVKINSKNKIISAATFENDPLNEKLEAQMYPLHTGEFGGLFGRILVFISGFIPIILFISGIRFNYWRGKSRKYILK